MADKLAKTLAEEGFRVRVYAPFGDLIPGMSYLIRRLLENTANSSFLRQNQEQVSIDQLLAAPVQAPIDGDLAAPVLDTSFENTADTDFSQATQRAQAAAALKKIQQQLGQRYSPIINGEAVHTDSHIDSLNPAQPQQLVGRVGLASQSQADQAMTVAQAAFPGWAATPVQERAAMLRRAADIMADRRHELNAWMVYEVGKPLGQADPEVSEAIDFCRYYAEEMERLDRGYAYDYPGETNRYRYAPRGIALVILPGIFP
jgi:RHH-type proline utilization regulon transcriptional repressor/proline dehydrogenase/delta 1-pyrroline-5-carboxylate dehydrogenase